MAQESREQWGSHIGFIFAAVGSAVGIGNIWRFPYIVGTNGGGAFLVTYFIVIFSFGLAFMILELAVGRHYKTSVLSSFARIRKRFKWAGLVMVGVTFVILSYYLVVLGWILSYFVMAITGASSSFDEYTSSISPVFAFLAVLAINFVIIKMGVRKGIERMSKVGVLLLIGIIIPLTVFGMTLPGSEKGIEFYLTPVTSEIFETETWAVAFGQAFFSLSVGMGVLLVYGSYIKSDRPLLSSSLIIILADLAIAFMAGLMIFSIVFANGMEPDQGTSLVFRVMPSIFSSMEYGELLSMLFFFLLLLAGITSSISMYQLPVSALEDDFRVSRNNASAVIALLLLVVGLPSALSYSSIGLNVSGLAFFDLVDTIFGTYGIAVSAVVFSIVATWFMDRKRLLEEINRHSPIVFPAWTLRIVKVALPVLIISTIIGQIVRVGQA
jgi:NSS family neurotransmitter:Na+ symporter